MMIRADVMKRVTSRSNGTEVMTTDKCLMVRMTLHVTSRGKITERRNDVIDATGTMTMTNDMSTERHEDDLTGYYE